MARLNSMTKRAKETQRLLGEVLLQLIAECKIRFKSHSNSGANRTVNPG